MGCDQFTQYHPQKFRKVVFMYNRSPHHLSIINFTSVFLK